MTDKKRVSYLLGTGASQAELTLQGALKGILMADIVDEIPQDIAKIDPVRFSDVNDELAIDNTDVEHLITLYEASGTHKHMDYARVLKKCFRKEIEDRINQLGASYLPKLLTAMLDMYEIPGNNEELAAIITLNYDDLAERAIQAVKDGINYPMTIENKHSNFKLDENSFPFLKLHGSFNWKNEYPIALEDKISDDDDVLWIPPGVL
jgi:hypothetical protein